MYTYILGAGASYDTLPLAMGLKDSLANFVHELNVLKNVTEASSAKRATIESLIEELNELLAQSSRHQSIDTYARMLYLTKEFDQYDRLCFLLTLYFHFEQSHKYVHHRYDHFLATILKDDTLTIPDEFTFLSWNYDYQFEKAISLYIRNNNYFECAKKLNLLSNLSEVETGKLYSFFKLNGTAFFLPPFKTPDQLTGRINEYKEIKLSIEEILDLYEEMRYRSRNYTTSLSFAWSKEKERAIESLKQRLENTKVLIIIGYSFPYFNRIIDMQLIKHFKHVEKIIIQTDSKSSLQLESKMKALWPHHYSVKIEIVTDTSQFFIPFEYNAIEIPRPNLANIFH